MNSPKSKTSSPVPKKASQANSRNTSRSPKSRQSAVKSPNSKRSQSPPKSRSKTHSLANELSDLSKSNENELNSAELENLDEDAAQSSEPIIEEEQVPKEEPLVCSCLRNRTHYEII